MNRRKVIFLLVSLVFIISFAPTVFAAATDYMPDILENFFKWLFFTLPEQARNGDETFVIYFKLILWLLLFPIVFFGANKIFPDSRRISGLIAGIFALIAVIFIPKGILVFIFSEFSAVTSILMALAPVFIGVFVRSKIPDDLPMLKNGIMVLIGVLLIMVGGYFTAYSFSDESTNLFDDLGAWSTFFGAFAIIWGIGGFLFGFGLGRGNEIGDSKWSFGGGDKEEKEAKKEEQKKEKLERKEANADSKMLELASSMEHIDGKMELLNSQELSKAAEDLKEYEKQRDYLHYLEQSLINAWNPTRALYSAVRFYKDNPKVFGDRADELEENFKKFQGYMRRVAEILTIYKSSLEKQESVTKSFKKLEDEHHKLVDILGNIGVADLKWLRTTYGFDKQIEEESKRADEIKSNAKGRGLRKAEKEFVDRTKKRNELLTKAFGALQRLRKEDDNLGKMAKEKQSLLNELKQLDRDDIKLCEQNLKKVTKFGMLTSFFELVRGIKKFIWLGTHDVRKLYTDIRDFKEHTDRKIEINGRLKEIENEEQRIQDYLKKLIIILKRIDQIFMASDLKDLQKIK